MAKVPTDEVVKLGHRARGHVARIVRVFRHNNALLNVLGSELLNLGGHLDERTRVKSVTEQFANIPRRVGQLIESDRGALEAPLSCLHLPPKLARRLFALVVEVAAKHRGV